MSGSRTVRAVGVAGFAALAGQAALADTTVSNARTEALATSGAGAVTITSDGSVKPASGAAITVDSDASVINGGTISIQDVDNTTGVLAIGGHSGAITNNGAITVDETTTDRTEEADDDGDYDGAFAAGGGRYGVRVTGPEAFTGDIINNSGGVITVEGSDSAGISVETELVGSIVQGGAISVTGDRVHGVRTTGKVGGAVTLDGSISVLGDGATGALIGDDVAGVLKVQGSILSTGYRYTSRSTDDDFLATLDADDLLQGGSALVVQGSLGRGLLLDAPPTDSDEDEDDEDGDGTADAGEGTASVITYGQAPAILLGAVGRDIGLGNVGPGDDAYGMVIRGSVGAYGVYDGISATALQVGVDGGGLVDLSGGIRNSGAVAAVTYEAAATAIRLGAGTTAGGLVNSGTISAAVVAEGEATATAIDMEAGALVSTLTNTGTLSASVTGEVGDAWAIRDLSGALRSVENTGSISADVIASDDEDDLDDDDTDATNETVTGKATALDLSANTTGVVIRQSGVGDGDDGDDGVADADDDGDGVDDADEPSILGDIILGSGDDQVEVSNGTVIGDITFGRGVNALSIDGGASVKGSIYTSGGTVALSVGTGSLEIDNVETLSLSSLDLASAASLLLTVDPAAGAATSLDVAGAANLASGAKIGVELTSLLKDEASYVLIRAGALSSGALDETLLGDIPYLYNAALLTDLAAGTLSLDLSRKTAGELALPAAVASAYEPVIEAIDLDGDMRDAFLAQTSRAGLIRLYQQMLPNYTGSIFEAASATRDAFSRVIDDRQGPDAGGVWLQEVATVIQRNNLTDSPGYTSRSFGLVGGVEFDAKDLGVLGLTVGGTSSQLEDEQASAAESLSMSLVQGGGYWRYVMGDLSANAQARAGRMWVKSNRAVYSLDEEDASYVAREAQADWSGWTVDARLSASYEARLGPVYARPSASLDYLRLQEGAYTETGGGEAMNLAVESRVSSRTTAFAGVALGAQFGGRDGWWGPEVTLGYRDVIAGGVGSTTAQFVSGSSSFTLLADEIEGGGLVARGGLRGEIPGGGFALEGGAEMRGDLTVYDLRLAAHVRF